MQIALDSDISDSQLPPSSQLAPSASSPSSCYVSWPRPSSCSPCAPSQRPVAQRGSGRCGGRLAREPSLPGECRQTKRRVKFTENTLHSLGTINKHSSQLVHQWSDQTDRSAG